MCGDFNDTPESTCIGALEAKLSSCNKSLTGGAEPPYTTHKFRPKEGMVTRTIDYIFTLKDKDSVAEDQAVIKGISGCLDLPNVEDLPETGFPSPKYPSDHLALGFEFQLGKK
jgi:hypothetical protein